MDNSASFDKLMPLLETKSALCLDISGNGKSSHFPKGSSIYYTDYLFQLRYILKYLFNWDKDLIFLGHSFGSSLLFNYAAIYPEEVNKMINIDCARFRMAIKSKNFIERTRNSIEAFLSADQNHVLEKYNNIDECIDHMFSVRENLDLEISKDNCRILCERGVSNMGNGELYFTHDTRLSVASLNRNTYPLLLALSSKLKCKVLNIHPSRGINVDDYGVEEEKNLKVMKESCKSLKHLVLDGSHHIHLETPESVAPHINTFLNT